MIGAEHPLSIGKQRLQEPQRRRGVPATGRSRRRVVAGRERARVIDPDTQVIEIIDVGSLFGVMRIASASGLLSPKRLKSFTLVLMAL
jgi:hypothetical protein